MSSSTQNLDRQIIALTKAGVDARDIFTDKFSGKDFERPNYLLLRDRILREGDVLYVTSLDRLGRNKLQTIDEFKGFQKRGITVRILDLPTTLISLDGQEWVINMVNNVIIEVLASIAENEREKIRSRQREGIDAALASGKHLGRNAIGYPENWQQVYGLWKAGNLTAVQAMRLLGLKKSTFYKLAREYKNTEEE